MKRMILFLIIVLCALVVVIHLNQLHEHLKSYEETYSGPIEYGYDSLNQLEDEFHYSEQLVESMYFAKEVKKTGPSSFLASFEKTYFGTVQILFPEPLINDTELEITIGEQKTDDKVWVRGLKSRFGSAVGINYYHQLLTLPEGSKTYTVILPERTRPSERILPTYWKGGVAPFCYCEISGYPGELSTSNFIQKAVFHPFDDTLSSFVSDNEILNEVYQLCKDTAKATTYSGLFVDGYRELTPYEADSYINQLSWFSVSNDASIAKNTLNCLLQNHTWPTEWIIQTIFLAYEYYMYTGDLEYLRTIYPNLQMCTMSNLVNEIGLLDTQLLDEKTENNLGVITVRDIIDWPTSERDGFSKTRIVSQPEFWLYTKEGISYKYTSLLAKLFGFDYASLLYSDLAEDKFSSRYRLASPNAVVNAFFYQALRYMEFISAEIGLLKESHEYKREADETKTIFQKSFINRKSGLVKDSVTSRHSSLHSNMFALDFGLIPEDSIDKVVLFLKSKGMSCSVYGSQFLIESLFKYEEQEIGLSLMTAEEQPSWLHMKYGLKSKLTTEAWSFYAKQDMDINHAWGTSPLNLITRYLIGIKPAKPGFVEVNFRPKFASLRRIQAKVPTAKGSILIDYERLENVVSITITIPEGVTVFFTIPLEADIATFRLDKKNEISANFDTEITINSGLHDISYEID